MEQVTMNGKELRYWSFSKVEKAEDGSAKVVPGWVKAPTTITVDKFTSAEEIIQSLQPDEILNLVNAGKLAEASKRAGTVPEGSFSKAMVIAATKAFGALPQFAALKSADKRNAVMAWVSGNEAIKQGFLAAASQFAEADSDDDDE